MESANKRRSVISQGAIFFSSSKPPRSPHSITRTISILPNYPISFTSHIGSSVFFQKAADNVVRSPDSIIDPKIEEEKRLRKTISNRMSARRSKERKDRHLLEMEKKEKALKVHLATLVPEFLQSKHKRDELEKENEFLRKMVEEKLEISRLAERDTKELQAEIKLFKEGNIEETRRYGGQEGAAHSEGDYAHEL